MFFNFKVCLTTCFCSLKEIKVGCYEFSRNQKIMGFHDLGHGTGKYCYLGDLKSLGLGRPILSGSLQGLM